MKTKFTLILFLVLLVPIFAFPQSPNRDEYHIYVGKPTITAKTLNALSYDYTNKQIWKSVSTSTIATVKWELVTDQNIINSAFGIPGPKGDKGDKGDPGTPGVCPSCPPSGGGSFPWIVVVGTGNDDAAFIAALSENRNTNKPIMLVGTLGFGEISVPKEQYRLTLIMWGATINIRSSATAWLKRTLPVNNKEALDFYSPAQFIILGGKITGSQTQVAFDLGASYMSRYEDIRIINFKTAIHLRFALRTTIENCHAQNCLNGFLVDIGNWPDASYTSSNAQSNQTTISNCRVDYQIANASGDVAYGVYGCSGVVIENIICEGAKYKKAIDKDFKMCPNDKDFTARNLHLEGIYGNAGAGTGEAYIYIRLVGVAVIDGVYSQYGGCFVDAGGSPGELDVHILHCSWLVNKNGKLFNNAGGVRWTFDTNSYQSLIFRPSEINTAFTGTPVTQYTGALPAPPNTYRIQ